MKKEQKEKVDPKRIFRPRVVLSSPTDRKRFKRVLLDDDLEPHEIIHDLVYAIIDENPERRNMIYAILYPELAKQLPQNTSK